MVDKKTKTGINKRGQMAVAAQEQPSQTTKNVPTGVKIIVIWYYICIGILLLLMILLFAGSTFLGALIPSLGILSALGSAFLILIGLGLLIGVALIFFIARGLWKCKKWARILVIVFSCIGVLGGLISLLSFNFSSIVSLLISGLIGGYLLFSKKVKEAFA